MIPMPPLLSRLKLGPVHPAAIAGIVLLVGAATFNGLFVEPGETKLQSLQEALARRSDPRVPDAIPIRNTNDPAVKLQSFYAFFRRDSRISDWLARIYDVADRAGVAPKQVDYRVLDDGAAPLLRYEVSLPLVGDYGTIRSFAEGVLNAVPVASLDHISFRRQRAAQGEIEAELKFTLYLADPS